MAGLINFVASDYLENTTGLGASQYTRQSSYSFSKDSFKKLWSIRYYPNRDTAMNTNHSAGYTARSSPIEITVDGTSTSTAGILRGQTLTLDGVGGSIGTVRSVYPDANLNVDTNIGVQSLVLNSLTQSLPDNTDLYFSSDEAIIYLQFDTEGDLVDRDQVYLLVDQKHTTIIIDHISKELTTGGYTTISPNSTTGIGRHITYIGVTSGESSLLN